jgi:hypothetical protein
MFSNIVYVLQSAHQQVLSKLAQCEQQLREHSEKHQQEIINIESEHQEKVLTYLILNPVRCLFGAMIAQSV